MEIADNVYEAAEATDGPLTIRESEINQLLTEDLALPTQIDGADADITYSVEDSKYVSVEGSTLKVTRPYAGEGNYSFTLTATMKTAEGTVTQEFPSDNCRRNFCRYIRRICICIIW
ncbi:MAG: immunoglobulin-like domain-containing protein [Lachnoclostridium sp.]